MAELCELCCTGCMQCCNACVTSGIFTNCALFGCPECNCGTNDENATQTYKYHEVKPEILPQINTMNRDTPLKF